MDGCADSSGRPIGSKTSNGYAVGTSGGRPSGTIASDVSSSGRLPGTKATDAIVVVEEDEFINLPSELDLSEDPKL